MYSFEKFVKKTTRMFDQSDHNCYFKNIQKHSGSKKEAYAAPAEWADPTTLLFVVIQTVATGHTFV